MIDLLPQRLRAKIDPQPGDGCWLWTGAPDGRGYGAAWLNGHLRKAHAAVYELLVGPVPEGLELDHLCKVKACVRPSHLEPVTHAENMRRAGLSGIAAVNAAKTGCPRNHPYDASDTSGRRCAACRRETVREATRRYRAKQRAA